MTEKTKKFQRGDLFSIYREEIGGEGSLSEEVYVYLGETGTGREDGGVIVHTIVLQPDWESRLRQSALPYLQWSDFSDDLTTVNIETHLIRGELVKLPGLRFAPVTSKWRHHSDADMWEEVVRLYPVRG